MVAVYKFAGLFLGVIISPSFTPGSIIGPTVQNALMEQGPCGNTSRPTTGDLETIPLALGIPVAFRKEFEQPPGAMQRTVYCASKVRKSGARLRGRPAPGVGLGKRGELLPENLLVFAVIDT